MYRESLKHKAHVFTLLSLWWTLFSGFCIFDFVDARRTLDVNALPDIIIWFLHLIFISLAAHFARTETATPTLCLSDEVVTGAIWHLSLLILFANVPLLAAWRLSWGWHLALHLLFLTVGAAGLTTARKRDRD